MVYGARLESVFTGNRNVGSNPTLSATLRPAGFGWQATLPDTRNRTLGVGVSPEALAKAEVAEHSEVAKGDWCILAGSQI